MDKNVTRMTKGLLGRLLLFTMMSFVVLTTCPIKNSIKVLAGIPITTEQGSTKRNQPIVRQLVEPCSVSEQATSISAHQATAEVNGLMPIVLFTMAFLFLFGTTDRTGEGHPQYGNLKIQGTLPIFLQFRKLLI